MTEPADADDSAVTKDAALEALERACALDPSNLEAHGLCAEALHRLGRDAEAIAHLRAAARQAPDPAPWRKRARTIERSDLSPEQRARLSEASRLLAAGDPDAARPLFGALVQDRPRCLPAWLGLIGALEAAGEAAAADEARARMVSGWPRRRTAVGAAAARRLSPRGLVFDPRERFPIRAKEQVLARVAGASELRRTPGSYLVIDPGGGERLRRPVIPLEPDGSDDITARHQTAESFVAAIDNALLVGRGLVITNRGEAISDLLGPPKSEKSGARILGGDLIFSPERFADGACDVQVFDTPGFLLAGPTDASFGDWINSFPTRLTLARAAKLSCPVVVRSDLPPKLLEMLEALGVDQDRLLLHFTGGVSIFPRLYVSSWPLLGRFRPMAGWFDVYGRAAAAAPSERPRIYLTRLGVASRRLVNEDEIIQVFESRGFRIVAPESLDFRETLELFAGPSIVAGPYGSNLRNLVFCRQKPVGFFLMPPYPERFVRGSALFLAEAGVRFGYVKGRPAPGHEQDDPNLAPWVIDQAEVERKLDRLLDVLAAPLSKKARRRFAGHP